jgi:cobalt-zinc-cadmium efflux system protein
MAAVSLNMVLALTQIIYAGHAHSVSLLSDALHNLGDVMGLILSWGAQIVSFYPARGRYTYGYKKLTILAAFMNAVLLMSSVGIITYEAITKIFYPHPMDEMRVLLIASLGILINGGTALLFMKEKENDINIKAAFLHLVLDALTSFGVVISAVLVYYTHYQWIDAVIAFLIAGVILFGSWKLISRAFALLVGAVPPHIDHEEVYHYLMGVPGIEAVYDLHIWAISTRETALTAHILVPNKTLTDADYESIRNALLQKFNIQNMTLQIIQQPC